MALRKALLIAATSMVVVMGSLLPAAAFWSWPTNHVVGDNKGWMLGVDYDDWARWNTGIPVGDTLEFLFDPDLHNVVLVDEDDYNNCIVPNNADTWDYGDDYLLMDEPGKYFFISGMNDDCSRGMKLAITVI